MFNFSSKTVVDRKFKITDLYKQMNASKEARKDGAMIESIALKNVLSPQRSIVMQQNPSRRFMSLR